ncbi:MAG: quinonprotein alcohol dehydrogenase [Planctomycetota bacterium]|nr:MAG: quinonprotein alcohol dehydrogenase [Planctomycetota bacterium]REK38420.1 MAG: quinonprotein alcohol dehydrogenase [Planctomycetota bacterium]
MDIHKFFLIAIALLVGGSGCRPPESTTSSGVWADFRGPTQQGHAGDVDVPTTWSEAENVRWKTAIRGRGHSTPIIWKNQIWLTTATRDGKKLFVICVDRESGEVVLEKMIFEVDAPEIIDALNSYASPSAVVEEGRVYVHFGTYGTACLDTDSFEVVWSRRDLTLDHGRGPGSSPILWQDLLIVNCDGRDVQYVVALDKATGQTRWKTPRSIDYSTYDPEHRKAYSTPVVITVDGQEQLISPGAQATMGYEPSTGREIWKMRYKGFSNVSRPVTAADTVFLSTGFEKASLLAVKLGGTEDVTDSHLLWTKSRQIPIVSSMITVDGMLFMVSDGGIASCYDAQSGEQYWIERLGGKFTASPVHVAGRLYFCNVEGRTFVVAAEKDFRLIAENNLDSAIMASPAMVEDAIYIRTETHLYRIEDH